MSISCSVNLSRLRRQSMYCPSMSLFVSLLILRVILDRLIPANLLICPKVLPFSQYIFINSLSCPVSILNLVRSKSTLSRYLSFTSRGVFKVSSWIFLIRYTTTFPSSGIALIAIPCEVFPQISSLLFYFLFQFSCSFNKSGQLRAGYFLAADDYNQR